MSKLTIYTDGGCDESNGKDHAGWGTHVILDNVSFTLGGAIKEEHRTNNVAELTAAYHALKIASMLDENEPHLYMDSRYVLDNMSNGQLQKWAKNKWIKSDGQPVKNAQLWNTILQELNLGGATPKYTWVKGHSGNHGNEAADEGATAGKELSRKECFDQTYFKLVSGNYTDIPDTVVRVYRLENVPVITAEEPVALPSAKPTKEKPVKVVKEKILAVPQMLCGSRIIMTAFKDTPMIHNRYLYNIISYEDKDEIKARNLGKPSADTFLGVVLLTDKLMPLEVLKRKQDEISPPNICKPVVIGWDKLKSGPTWPSFVDGSIYDTLTVDVHYNMSLGKKLVTQYLYQPRVAYEGIEQLNSLAMRLSSYIKGEVTKDIYIDITDRFIEEVPTKKEGVTKLEVSSKLDDAEALLIMSNIPGFNKPIKLCLGIDAPDRNSVKRILTEVTGRLAHIKVMLLITSITPHSFRFLTIFDTGTDIAMYGNPYSNVVFK